MLDNEQQLLAAATEYLARLDTGDLISIDAFAAMVDPVLRAELVPYLQALLETSEPLEPIVLTPAEHTLADRVTARTLARVNELVPVPAQTLTAVRMTCKLSVQALAQQINLPVDLLARIERGGVTISSLPARLMWRLAHVLDQTEAQLRAVLQGLPSSSLQIREAQGNYTTRPATSQVLFDADADTVPHAEHPMSFRDALAASTATPEQRAEWQDAE